MFCSCSTTNDIWVLIQKIHKTFHLHISESWVSSLLISLYTSMIKNGFNFYLSGQNTQVECSYPSAGNLLAFSNWQSAQRCNSSKHLCRWNYLLSQLYKLWSKSWMYTLSQLLRCFPLYCFLVSDITSEHAESDSLIFISFPYLS